MRWLGKLRQTGDTRDISTRVGIGLTSRPHSCRCLRGRRGGPVTSWGEAARGAGRRLWTAASLAAQRGGNTVEVGRSRDGPRAPLQCRAVLRITKRHQAAPLASYSQPAPAVSACFSPIWFRPGHRDRCAVLNEGLLGTVYYFSVSGAQQWKLQRLGWLS